MIAIEIQFQKLRRTGVMAGGLLSKLSSRDKTIIHQRSLSQGYLFFQNIGKKGLRRPFKWQPRMKKPALGAFEHGARKASCCIGAGIDADAVLAPLRLLC